MTEAFNFPRFDGRALCAEIGDPDLWFPDKGGSAVAAKRVCVRCEVTDQCLAWALEHREAGVWGNTSDHERRDINKKRRTGRPRQPIDHGTERGAAQHKRRGEQPCTHCAAAASAAWTARQKRDECPVCGEWMLKASVPRHVTRRHPDADEAA